MPSEAFVQNQASPRHVGASPKKQDNRRRLRTKAAQNLSYRGSETPHQIQWAFFIFLLVDLLIGFIENAASTKGHA